MWAWVDLSTVPSPHISRLPAELHPPQLHADFHPSPQRLSSSLPLTPDRGAAGGDARHGARHHLAAARPAAGGGRRPRVAHGPSRCACPFGRAVLAVQALNGPALSPSVGGARVSLVGPRCAQLCWAVLVGMDGLGSPGVQTKSWAELHMHAGAVTCFVVHTAMLVLLTSLAICPPTPRRLLLPLPRVWRQPLPAARAGSLAQVRR